MTPQPPLRQQVQLARPVSRLDARAAVELTKDLPHVHVDRAGAQAELLRHLAVGAPDRDEPDNLELAPAQARAVGVGGGARPEPAAHRLAERRDLARGRGRERPGAELAGGAVGVAEAIERRL